MPLTWHHIPVLRLLLPFMAGVLWGMYTDDHIMPATIAMCCCAVVFAYAAWYPPWFKRFDLQWIYGIGLQLLGVLAGYIVVYEQTPVHADTYFMHDADSVSVFVCRITKPPVQTEKSIRLEVDVQWQMRGTEMRSVTGSSIFYIRRDSSHAINWQYGDAFIVHNIFKTPEPTENPGAFDYARYLRRQGIYHIALVLSDEVQTTGNNSARWQWKGIFRARDYFHAVLHRYVRDPDALTVGEALVIGTRTDISEEIRNAYAHTGTMHILAVSGLHVGILFAVLEFLLRPVGWFNRSPSGKVIKCLLLLAVIWWYACLAGLSPSVNRSAVMFSFLSLGKLLERQNNTFNVLFASMLVLMLGDPWCITDAGFQLSYLAVGGIVFFQPMFQKIYRPRNVFIRYVWTMITVSIAAQLATVPVTMYYFHQFPNYFLLSNLLAIPISFIVLVAGLVLFAVGGLVWIAPVVAKVFEWSLICLNGSVVAVDGLPWAITDNIHLTLAQMFLLYALLMSIGAAMALRDIFWLRAGLGVMLIMACLSAVLSWRSREETRLVLYAVPGQEVFSLHIGGCLTIFADSPISDTGRQYLRQVKPDLIAHGGAPVRLVLLQDTVKQVEPGWGLAFPWLIAGGEVVFLLDSTSVHQLPESAPQATFLYILGNPYLNLPDLRQRFPAARLIIGNTSVWKRRSYYRRAGKQVGFEVHDLQTQHAWVSRSAP